ncbi:ABC transporter ATP-binding protein [Shinella sumterensis]|uniref:ABC transporter ATP-binding protein n=1 Tax=Shinella sumterensis TaxID=1967501 RepID=UPI003F86233C
MSELAIDARGLDKGFGSGETRTRALDGVSMQARFGQMLLIVGPSGSGKTTLLSVISGILRPDAGSVSIDGVDLWSLGKDRIAEFRLHRIGFVFQDYHLFPRLSTAENVAIPLILKRLPWDQAMRAACAQLEVVGLGNRARMPPAKLSGGEQQRVAIARALAPSPKLLIADEPTGNLDTETGRQIADLLFSKQAERGMTLVLVTHDPALAARCSRQVAMRSGEIVSGAAPAATVSEAVPA